MAYAVVFWTEVRQYSIASSSEEHGDVVQDCEVMADQDEGEKGAKSALKAIASPATIIKIGGRCTYPVVANSFSVIILLSCYKYDAL